MGLEMNMGIQKMGMVGQHSGAATHSISPFERDMKLRYLHLYVIDFLGWILNIIVVAAHRQTRILLQLLEFVYLWLFGCNLKPTDNHLQVSRILFRNIDPYFVPFQTEMRVSLKFFGTWHQSFENLNYLNNPCVSLSYVDEHFVYFLEHKPTQLKELYDTRKHPFFEVAQWKLAYKSLKVPKAALLEYTKGIKLPKANIVYCSQTSRCGSTALVQAIGSLKGWRAISEISWCCDLIPTSLSTYEEVKRYATSQQFKEIVVACIKAQLAPYPDGSCVFWKTNNNSEAWVVPVLKEFFPEIKIILMTRKGNAAANSFMKAYPRSLWFDLVVYGYNLIPGFLLKWNEDVRSCYYASMVHGLLKPEFFDFVTDGRLTLYEMYWLRTVCSIALHKELCKDVPLLLVEFDAYISDLASGLTKVLEYMDVPLSNLQDAIDAYQLQSQANSIYSGHPRREAYGVYGRDAISEAKCEALSKKLGYPGFRQRLTKKHFVSDRWQFLVADD